MTDKRQCPKCGAELVDSHHNFSKWACGSHSYGEVAESKECLRNQLTLATQQIAYEQERNANNVMQAEEQIAKLHADNERLRAVVDRASEIIAHPDYTNPEEMVRQLRAVADPEQNEPATLDGATVTDPAAELWYIAPDGKVYCHYPWSDRDIPKMYSTRAAAEAAQKEIDDA